MRPSLSDGNLIIKTWVSSIKYQVSSNFESLARSHFSGGQGESGYMDLYIIYTWVKTAESSIIQTDTYSFKMDEDWILSSFKSNGEILRQYIDCERKELGRITERARKRGHCGARTALYPM